MRAYKAISGAILAIFSLPAAAAEWRIVEDDFLYMRQDGSGGSVMLYCSEPGHRLFPVVVVWPKPVSTSVRGAGTGIIKLILPGADRAKPVWATVYGNVTSVKLDRETDALLEDLRAVARQGGSVWVRSLADDGSEMTQNVDLSGYLAVARGFQAQCMERSELLLRRLGRMRPVP